MCPFKKKKKIQQNNNCLIWAQCGQTWKESSVTTAIPTRKNNPALQKDFSWIQKMLHSSYQVKAQFSYSYALLIPYTDSICGPHMSENVNINGLIHNMLTALF